ncbi:Y-family DNA polymerase [Pararhizobium gei]|uniref:Y-family DNA polymerase n=1 Tax=Pararhizobium gei TaxID=1395951 RepID=UPI0023DA4099|nr:DNA polymerase Y family protein [Rhizobium gei]
MRIVALDRLAETSWLKLGQGIAEARAMLPGIDVIPADLAKDRRFLEGLADWCDRYTPLVALDGADGLFLDISGCSHLHGGEKALLDDLVSRLWHLGIQARGAVSSAAGLSWAMARFGAQKIIDPDDAERVLLPLSLSCLRLPAGMVEALARVGLKLVGDILHAPRAPLARRFGPQLLLRLDQALGLEEEALSPRLPVADLSAERRLAEPIQGEEDILGLALQLARRLKDGLEERAEGGRLFELLLFRVDGKVFRIQAATSAPLRDPERIANLYRERLQAVHDELDAGFGFELLRLSVLKSEYFRQIQDDFSGAPDKSLSLAVFADRVAARLGPHCLSMPVLADSHVPERAEALDCLSDIAQLTLNRQPFRLGPTAHLPSARPLRLFRHPEPVDVSAAEVPDGAPEHFRWRRTLYRVKRAEGPERIAPEWWIDGEKASTRDYFRVEDADGYRFWLFRNGFYTENPHPQWFMHGIFA